jgi:O-antigen/teichoic acid export membrane protein
MGIVIRQSFWSTVIAYLGVLIGYFNTLYFRPGYMDLGEIGIFTLVTANAMLISPFCTAGMPGTFMKYFPEFDNNATFKNQFFTFQITVILILNLIIIGLGFLLKDFIAGYFSDNSPEYVRYLGITAIVIVVNSLFDMFFSYCRSNYAVLVPSLLRDVFLRLGALLLIAGLAFKWWSFEMAVTGIALNYGLAVLILLIYVMIKYDLRFAFSFAGIDKKWRRRIFDFGWYSMLLALSFAIMNNVSYSQVAASLGDSANGIFTTCFFIGLIVEMPNRNMLKVLSPMFSKAMQENDMHQVKSLYQKGSITNSVFGFLLFIGILTNVDDLFAFIPQGSAFAEGFWVVVAVCAAKLTMMLFSFGQEILVYSKYYRYTLYFQIGAAVLLVILNIIFIPIWGLTGAGLSYLIAMFVHSFLKYYFVKTKMGVSPFTNGHLPLLIISLAIFLVFWYLPLSFGPVVNIAVRSIATTLLFVGAIWKMNVSPDINKLIKTTFEKIRNR